MFEHSVKVPRHYKIASNIFKKVSTEGGSVKTLLYDDKLKHFRTNVLYALITETIKHASEIDRIFENSGILVNEPRLDPWLAKVLTAELLFGKKALPGKSKPEQTILSYKDQFVKFSSENPDDMKIKGIKKYMLVKRCFTQRNVKKRNGSQYMQITSTQIQPCNTVVLRPRYVRINTNLLTTSDAIRAFQDEGYKFIRCTSGSYDDYLKQIETLTEYDFSQDYHVKTVFVFAPGTKLHDHELYLSNQIILQDKATTLAVHFLSPPPGSVVLDMCAAPGMKTTQLAAFLRNQGKVYAVERNESRYGTLCDFVKSTASKCVETIHKDALEIKRGDFDDVEYILLDPSCSGSGMELSVHNYIEEARLAKLTSLQEKFLKHAMNAFPNAKRIVYSTCSIYPEENERVITNVVKTSRAKWRVQDVKEILKGQWNNFGSGMYGSMGTRCLYAKPESDKTTGFFLAVLDREKKESDKNKTEEKESLDVEATNEKKHEINTSNEVVDTKITSADAHNDTDVNVKKKKKKDKSFDIIESSPKEEQNVPEMDAENLPDDNIETRKKKKRKKNKSTDDDNSVEVNEVQNLDTKESQFDGAEEISLKKKKKKKNKNKDEETNELDNSANNCLEDISEDITIKSKKKKKEKHRQQDIESVDDILLKKKHKKE